MIRKAKLADIKNLYQLEKLVFKDDAFALSLQSFYYHIRKNKLFVYEYDSKVIAYALWLERKNYYRLYSICIDIDFQGKGIGDKILKFSFNELALKSYQLEVKISNTKAISFYKKHDFQIKKVLKNYYPNDEDGYLMVKQSVKKL